ncbi:MAG: TetR/AcrR family transcriptional regulator [Mycobacteriaceae bacterium]
MTQDALVKESRTQAQRSSEMRTRLLDAAIESLVELGYARTSTQEIARRAGVSRGAQLHHFPTKESLVVAALGHLAEKRRTEILEANPATSNEVSILFEAFSGTLFYAALELWVAARTDKSLHDAMIPLERQITEMLSSGATTMLGDQVSPAGIELSIELARGLAVSALFRNPESDRELRARLLPVWESMVVKK